MLTKFLVAIELMAQSRLLTDATFFTLHSRRPGDKGPPAVVTAGDGSGGLSRKAANRIRMGNGLFVLERGFSSPSAGGGADMSLNPNAGKSQPVASVTVFACSGS
ncbi:hypothetical protein GCM10010961_16320 [Pseudodonghicola xiamenensis]|uniref:Uncharacterized protein n=1 Tax=Pseudodonghicola xiamenensis TaxID=337702 RepID=A0A8J3H6K6_9RHOB|nr:hypothetical protein GCM10010961_16320 [Pseudodonghicola xiamenensis]